MIINGVKILTECSECSKGFDPDTDYADMKNEDDLILSWCRKCEDKFQLGELMKLGFTKQVAKKIMKEAIDECSDTIDYNTALEMVAKRYANGHSQSPFVQGN